MSFAHEQITSANEYFDNVVSPDFRDYVNDLGSLRKAFQCAGSLFHMHDWVYREFFAEIPDCKDEKAFSKKLAEQCSSFAIVRDIANASKHMILNSEKMRKVRSVSALSIGWVEGGFIGPFDGSLRVLVQTDSGYEVFGELAHDVLSMWLDMLRERSWRRYPSC